MTAHNTYSTVSDFPSEMRSAAVTTHTFTAIIHREDNLCIAECPEVGTASQGTTIDEALTEQGFSPPQAVGVYPVR
jgi:hypothetical protein